MKIEINYTETESLEEIIDTCTLIYKEQKSRLQQSRHRYMVIIRSLNHQLYETDYQKWKALHEEAESIEDDWKRWGVEF